MTRTSRRFTPQFRQQAMQCLTRGKASPLYQRASVGSDENFAVDSEPQRPAYLPNDINESIKGLTGAIGVAEGGAISWR